MGLFKATPEQIAAVDKVRQESDRYQQRVEASAVIGTILELAERVTYGSGGIRREADKRHTLYYRSVESGHIPLFDSEGNETSGARLVGTATEVMKKSHFKNTLEPIGNMVLNASVEIGLIAKDFIGTELVRPSVVLSVSRLEQDVHYRADQTPLAPIYPGTDEWAEMTDLVQTLVDRETELRSPFIRNR